MFVFSIDLFAVTSQQMVSESKSMAHKARDLRLVTTLEIRKNFKMEIIQRKWVPLHGFDIIVLNSDRNTNYSIVLNS